MRKLLDIIFVCLAAMVALCYSCDEDVNNVKVSNETFPIGTVTWSSEVTAPQREVITQLINNMVKVEATQFWMGTQSRSYARPNYVAGYTAGKDTIFGKERAHLEDTLYTSLVNIPYCIVYYNNGLAVGPVIEVTMPDYYIGKFEITQGQWDAVMSRRPTGTYCKVENLKGTASWYDETGKGDDVAAYNISFEDAVEFCQTLSRKTGLNFRLPTEAEWECAARGGKASRGYKYIGADSYVTTSWCFANACDVGLGNTNYGVHPGGELEPNELGIYDMGGNVSEWCGNSYYMYDLRDNNNPQGKAIGDTLVLRGGSWTQSKTLDFAPGNRRKFIRSSYSDQSFLDAIAYCGFRVVVTAK